MYLFIITLIVKLFILIMCYYILHNNNNYRHAQLHAIIIVIC